MPYRRRRWFTPHCRWRWFASYCRWGWFASYFWWRWFHSYCRWRWFPSYCRWRWFPSYCRWRWFIFLVPSKQILLLFPRSFPCAIISSIIIHHQNIILTCRIFLFWNTKSITICPILFWNTKSIAIFPILQITIFILIKTRYQRVINKILNKLTLLTLEACELPYFQNCSYNLRYYFFLTFFYVLNFYKMLAYQLILTNRIVKM